MHNFKYPIFVILVHSKSSKYKKLDTTPLTGPDHSDTVSALANKKAVEALELLLRKLPHKLTIKDDIKHRPDSLQDNELSNAPIRQYNIPKDPLGGGAPIPAFKPLKPLTGITSTYTLRLGPIEASTQHTVGHVDTGSHGSQLHSDKGPYSYNVPSKTVVIETQPVAVSPTPFQISPAPFQISPAPFQNSPAPFQQTYVSNLQPLDLYHSMSLKHGQGQTVVKTLPSAFLYQPYEIQKSIAYELN